MQITDVRNHFPNDLTIHHLESGGNYAGTNDIADGTTSLGIDFAVCATHRDEIIFVAVSQLKDDIS